MGLIFRYSQFTSSVVVNASSEEVAKWLEDLSYFAATHIAPDGIKVIEESTHGNERVARYHIRGKAKTGRLTIPYWYKVELRSSEPGRVTTHVYQFPSIHFRTITSIRAVDDATLVTTHVRLSAPTVVHGVTHRESQKAQDIMLANLKAAIEGRSSPAHDD